MLRRYTLAAVPSYLALLAVVLQASAQDTIFSGPQAGERLPDFQVKGVVGDTAGKTYNPIAVAEDKPILLMFFHQKTRPAFGLCRALAKVTGDLPDNHGLSAHLILLTDDPSSETTWAQNVVQKHLDPKLTVAISEDGQEGPGAYGLNRNVTLTILVGQKGVVTHNFALVQPQLQADGPAILEAVAAVTGAKDLPSAAELDVRYAAGDRTRGRMRNQRQEMRKGQEQPRGGQDPKLTSLLRNLINKQASDEAVEKAAKDIEAYVAGNEPAKRELLRIARTVVNSGRLRNYGTSAAQAVLKRWVARAEKLRGEPDKQPE
jgi:hypothetical protein